MVGINSKNYKRLVCTKRSIRFRLNCTNSCNDSNKVNTFIYLSLIFARLINQFFGQTYQFETKFGTNFNLCVQNLLILLRETLFSQGILFAITTI